MFKFPEIIAHRGASYIAPENTMVAFKEAVRLGADAIELDVHLTKDNKVVVIHDNRLERTTDGNGLVRENSLEEIKKLDAGSWFSKEYAGEKVPTLEEVLEYIIQYNKFLYIELKGNYSEIEKKVINIVEKYNYKDRVTIISFNKEYLIKVKKENQSIKTGYCFFILLGKPMDTIDRLKINELCSSYLFVKGLSLKDITEMKTNNIKIIGFTINSKIKMIQMICKRVDGIITDRPDKLKQLNKTCYKIMIHILERIVAK